MSAFTAQTPAQRAVDFLAQEVPRWSRENKCFSCHNDGDGARALVVALKLGYRAPASALAASTQWLISPAKWDQNRGAPGFNDKRLAHIQFAAVLAQGYEAGLVRERAALVEAAFSLASYQDKDGSWQADAGAVGSPVTYGTALATYLARWTLETADAARFAEPIARANRWLAASKPGSVPDASALLMALPDRRDCLDFLLAAQSSGGGWGPHAMTPAEVFDTALALLGLGAAGAAGEPIARGRAFLISRQLKDGSWPETTRPSGGSSYAQRISTSAWATLALIRTDAKR
jgi:hypothetical protein